MATIRAERSNVWSRRRSTNVHQRGVVSVDEVRAVMSVEASIDAAAELAERIAAVAGARRAQLASLRWTDEDDDQVLIDISWWWKRARQMSGIDPKWRLHDLRHWSATVAIGQGHDVRTVAGRLSHANPAMTLRVYAHAFAAADEVVAAGLGEILKGEQCSCAFGGQNRG